MSETPRTPRPRRPPKPPTGDPPKAPGGDPPNAEKLPPMIDPHGELSDVITDVPEMSLEDVEKRIGARDRDRERRRQRQIAAAGHTRIRSTSNRRRVLWRDSATILVGVVLALLAARFLLPGDNGPAASPSAGQTQVAVGSLPGGTQILFSAPPTIGGGVVPTGLHLEATPTPPPVITLPPATPRPRPTPSPTPKPGTTPNPTVNPTVKPTVKPTLTPAVARFSFTCDLTGHVGHFDGSASTPNTGATITSYVWSWGDGIISTTAGPTISHTFADAGPYSVILTIHTSTGAQDPVAHSASCP